MPTSATGLNFTSISDYAAGGITSAEAAIVAQIGKENPTATDLIALQTAVQQWSLAISTTSSVIKDLGDSLKGVIQRAS